MTSGHHFEYRVPFRSCRFWQVHMHPFSFQKPNRKVVAKFHLYSVDCHDFMKINYCKWLPGAILWILSDLQFLAHIYTHSWHSQKGISQISLLFYEVLISHELKNNRGWLPGAILDMLNLETVADSNSLHLLGTALRLNVQFFTFLLQTI